MARAKMSVVPPGAKGTTILTGLLGQAVCAQLAGAADNNSAAAMPNTGRRVNDFGKWTMLISLQQMQSMMPLACANTVTQAKKAG